MKKKKKKGGYNHLNGRKSTVSDFIPFNPIPPFSIFLLPLPAIRQPPLELEHLSPRLDQSSFVYLQNILK